MGNFFSSQDSTESDGFHSNTNSSDGDQDISNTQLPQDNNDEMNMFDSSPIQKVFFLLRQPVVDVKQIKEIVNEQSNDFLNQPDVAPTLPPNANKDDPEIQKIMKRIQSRTYLGDYALHLLVGRPASQNTPELLDLVKNFFLKEHPMNARNMLGSTPLHRACAAGNAAMVNALITWGASPDAVNNMNLTSLHMACYAGYADVVRILLQNGCAKQITSKCDYGLAPCDYVLTDEILVLLKSAHKSQKAKSLVTQ